jgi:hypothetical protein
MTHTTEGTEEVIKTDVLGRKRTSAAHREKLLGEFDQSGLSTKKYAELIGIKYQTLATWLQKRRQQTKLPMPPVEPGKWLEAVVESAAGRRSGAGLVLTLPGGVRMEVADEQQAVLAAVLIRTLAKPC